MTCSTCGANLDSTVTTCPACGAPVPVPAAAAGAPVASGASNAGSSDPGRDDPPPAGGGPGGQPPGSNPGSEGPTGGHAAGGYPPPGQPWGAPPPPHPSGLPSDVRGWGIAAHLAGLGAALFSAAIFGFVGPLFVWLLKRDDHPFIDHHAKEALNFHLSVLVAMAGGALLLIPAVIVGVLTLGIGLVLLGGLVVAAIVAWFVLPIIAAARAADGRGYRYPFIIRFVR